MITVLEYTKDKVVQGNLSNICQPKTFTWIDVFEPTPEEIKQISDISQTQLSDLNMVLGQDERPKVIEIEGPYSLIIFGAPAFEEGGVKTTPVYIYTSKLHNCVITIRNQDTKSIHKLKEAIESRKGFFDKGSSYFVYRLIDEILNTFYLVLEDIENKIDQIEDSIVSAPDISLISKIFEIKKTLIYFNKTITANREVIASIEKEYLTEIDKKRAKQFRTLYNDTVQLIDMSSTYRDILTGTLDTYLSSVSNNLNQVMKTLTVLTSFIMVPTLIASIYGMNFQFMPETGWKYGYLFAVGLMGLSTLGTYLFFKRKNWI